MHEVCYQEINSTSYVSFTKLLTVSYASQSSVVSCVSMINKRETFI